MTRKLLQHYSRSSQSAPLTSGGTSRWVPPPTAPMAAGGLAEVPSVEPRSELAETMLSAPAARLGGMPSRLMDTDAYLCASARQLSEPSSGVARVWLVMRAVLVVVVMMV
jgi:hypothetical protein